jgi:uncharacterized RDD family membrane protein YckC
MNTDHSQDGDVGHYGRKVILPRRMMADLIDGMIAIAIILVPVLVADDLSEVLPDSILRIAILGIPLGILYEVFRDWVGRGTSLGKRALGLTIISVEQGRPSRGSEVWTRNLLDLVPVWSFGDFISMCVDPHGQKFMDKRLKIQLIEGALEA